MSINFPTNPSINDQYVFEGKTWTWTGSKWNFIGGVPDPLKVLNYYESVGDITTNDIDLSTGNVFISEPSANITYIFSNPPASGTAYGFTLRMTPSATITVNWPTSVNWPGGVTPDAPANGETSVFVFYTQDGGTTYFGFVAGEDMS